MYAGAQMNTYPLYLDGRFAEGASPVEVINPATGEPFARIATVARAEVREAITRAHVAFQSWRKLTAKARSEWLQKLANELERRGEEIARTITIENGKPLAQSRTETAMAVDHLRWFAEEAKRAYGRIIPNWVEHKRNIVVKTPMGVVGAISPWNFPLML